MQIEQNSFTNLVSKIENTHIELQAQAIKSVSTTLTIRNWLIGHYIVEYEQNGEDRAEYGARVIENLVQELKSIKGVSATNLRLFRTFYTHYPQMNTCVSKQFKIQQTVSVKSMTTPIKQLLNSCSFSHFIELFKLIGDEVDLSKEPFSKLKRDMAWWG